jgi:hypothetical protein
MYWADAMLFFCYYGRLSALLQWATGHWEAVLCMENYISASIEHTLLMQWERRCSTFCLLQEEYISGKCYQAFLLR